MSLFPAYEDKEEAKSIEKPEVAFNVDCSPNISSLAIASKLKKLASGPESETDTPKESKKHKNRKHRRRSSSNSSDSSHNRKRHKKKRKHHKKIKDEEAKEQPLVPRIEEVEENLSYALDKNRDVLNLKIDQPSKRSRPRYNCPCKSLSGVYAVQLRLKKKKKPLRYFSKKALCSGQDDEAVGQELTRTVEQLNKAVHEDPQQVENWIKLVSFQDDYFKFQPIRYKTEAERLRAANQHKLDILERALAANPLDKLLQETWLSLALNYLTFDEASTKLHDLLRNGESFVLCIGKIMLTQESMTRCTSPAVLNLYKEALERIQRSRHLASYEQDNQTLELLYMACTFLEQCGNWELAWLILKLTLHLNISIDLPPVPDVDPTVLQLENEIVEKSSGVPVWHLWSRLEKVRAGFHFLPISSSEDFPQRVASREQVVDLIYHVRRPAHFRLLFLLPLLVKVPLLPRRHFAVATVSPQLSPWLLDSVEFQLASVFQCSPLLKLKHTLVAHLPPASAPQYIRNSPGQHSFLDYGTSVFDTIMDNSSGRQKVAVGVWYMKFLRWLDSLARINVYEPINGRAKTKTIIKEFLKRPQNRDTTLFYLEYALWEAENSDIASSIKTLLTLTTSNSPVLSQVDSTTKSDLCHLYRNLCELQISAGQLESAKETLQKLCSANEWKEVIMKMRHVGISVMEEEDKSELEDFFLPNFTVDWLACLSWALVLDKEVDKAVDVLKKAVEMKAGYIREQLFEVLIILLRNFDVNEPGFRLAIIREALSQFPMNSVFTSVMAEELVEGGGLWWTESRHLLHPPSCVGAVALICAMLERQKRNGEPDRRCRTTLQRLTTGDCKQSVLLHRMYLRMLNQAGDLVAIDTARVLAMESCPWNKDLYMEIIDVSPPQLLPLTDLMVEKDLRIHITPDEIDAMRD